MGRESEHSLSAFSAATDNKIRELHAEGCGVQKISKIIERGRGATLRRMKTLGLVDLEMESKVKGGMKKGFWTEDLLKVLRKSHKDGMSAREIAEVIGCSQTTVSSKMRSLGLKAKPAGKPVRPTRLPYERLVEKRADKPAPQTPKTINDPPHVQAYKAARRGVVIPPHLEAEYYELLKQGVPIAEAKARLGVTPTQEGRE